ncbi:MAG TPA: BamA/TamA family outer membrane protein [Bacteroidota bacterium]|nr:BamA/TamA family outer membrane protein [Bacteroidota bacterium]
MVTRTIAALFRKSACQEPRPLFLVVALLLGTTGAAFAEQAKQSADAYEVNKITLHVDGSTPPEVYREELQTVETPARFWTYLYSHVYKKLGSKPQYFDPILFDGDVLRLRQYLKDHGYSHAVVDTSLRFDDANKRVDLTIWVKENRRSIIDTLKILGIDSVAAEVKKEIYDGLLIKRGDPYVKDLIEQEQLRVLRIFRNGGYTNANVDNVPALLYLSTDDYTVTLSYHPGARYVFGTIETVSPTEVDSSVVFRQLDFVPGENYNEQKKTESEQNLIRLGIFESAKIESQLPVDSTKPPSIPVRILLRARELQEVTPELLVDDENNTFNAGLGIGYSNRDFFGQARNLSANLRFRLQSIQDLNFAGAFREGIKEPTLLTKTELTTEMIQPYFFTNKTSASWTVSAEYEKQEFYDLNTLRNRIGLTTKFSDNTVGFMDWDLERVGVSIADTTKVDITTFTGTREKQFNSILTLTLQQDKTNDVFSPSLGYFHSVSVEEAGFIPKVFNSLGSGLPYSQYYKFSFLERQYFSDGTKNGVVWAFRLHGGVAELYDPANTTPVPPTHKFFAGGSGSVRGWKSRDLAAFENPDQGGNVILEGNIESRVPLFSEGSKFWFLNLDNFMGALFVDYGNLWNNLSEMEIANVAIAAGGGLRYQTFVGPLRFDLGLRVYDPKEPQGQRWIFGKKFLTGSFSVVQIGIGQAF